MASKVKCPICSRMNDREETIPYKKRYYCIECFENSFSEEETSKHYFYLTFQYTLGRKPMQVEWIQCDRLISEGWTWEKIEDIFRYVYTIEGMLESNEHGAIGILPYYEIKARRFLNVMYDTRESEVYEIEGTDETVYAKQIDLTQVGESKEVKDIDSIWEDDDVWE